jgi:hypothetical protein
MPEHNYRLKLLKMVADGKVPTSGLWHTNIRHDDWCNSFCGGYCNCDPDIQFVEEPNTQNPKPN